MKYDSWLTCVRGCGERYSIYDVMYHCPECGGLLDVEHDLDALGNRSGLEWKELFDQRTRTNQWPYGSGVWGKKEWVCPQIDSDNIISLYEGHTNCFQAQNLGQNIGLPDLWVKQCGISHTGSFKDLGMTVLVSVVNQMINDGQPIRAVACASTGDTSAALSAYAAAAGIPAVILLPKGKVSMAQLVQPIANGALVLALDTDFDGCMAIVEKLTQDPTIYLANSMNSLRIEGQKTMGIEIAQQFNWKLPDWIIIPAGNLGNVSALGRGLVMMKDLGLVDQLPRIACAQAANANPLYLSYQTEFKDYHPVEAKPTSASAIQIGDPVSYERAVKVLKSFDGIVDQATEDELANASAMADATGLYTCPQTGVALGVLLKMITRGDIQANEQAVVISTAHGLKFTEFKIGYHEDSLKEVTSRYNNSPVELPPDLDLINKAINKAT
jgi:threonine synthase